MGVVVAFPSIKGAFKSLAAAAKIKKSNAAKAEELNVNILYIGLVVSIVVLFLGAYAGSEIGLFQASSVAIVGTIWIAIAGKKTV